MTKKLSLVFLFTLILISCSENQNEYEQATFIVDELSTSNVTLIKTDEEESLYDVKDLGIYETQVCLKDATLATPIVDQRFTTYIMNTEEVYKTDHSGCFKMTFNTAFNMDTCEELVHHEIKVKGIDSYTGTININIAVNPTGKNKLFDLRYSDKSIETLSAQKDCRDTEFVITSNSIKRLDYKSSDLTLNLTLTPAIERTDITGQRTQKVVTEAKNVQVEAKLLSMQNNGNVLISDSRHETKIINGKIKFLLSSGQIQDDLIKKSSGYKLLLNIKPKNSKLKAYSFYIESEDISFTKASDIVKTSNHESFQYEVMSIKENVNSSSIGIKSIAPIKSSFDELSYDNKQNHRILTKVCFYDKYSSYGQSIGEQEVVISSTDKSKFKVEQKVPNTDVFGCIKFYISKKYDVFKKNIWFKNTIAFEFGEEVVTRELGILPGNKSSPLKDLHDEFLTNEDLQQSELNLIVDNIVYDHIGKVEDSYYVNKDIQLFYKINYNFRFMPRVEFYNENKELKDEKKIKSGKIEAKVTIFSQNKENYTKNIKEINLKELKLLSTAKGMATIEKSGLSHFNISLPFNINDAKYLAFNSIALIELMPTDSLNEVSKASYIMRFNGANDDIRGEDLFSYNKEIGHDNEVMARKILEEEHAFSRSLPSRNNSLESYKAYMQTNMQSKFMSFTHHDFIKSEEAKKVNFTNKDMQMIRVLKNKLSVPKKLRKKICNYFGYVKGVIFDNPCIENIQNYIRLHNAKHIIELDHTTLGNQVDQVAYDNNVAKGYIIDGSVENYGSIKLGVSHMAANGTRASETWGETEARTTSLSGSIYYDGPPSIFFFTYGYTESHEKFESTVNSKMQMEFNRWYSSINKKTLKLSTIGVKFQAWIKQCSIIENIKDKRVLHICDTNKSHKTINEKWFFIGESDLNNNREITDGIKIGDKSFTQVIRGQDNFFKFWKLIENKDTANVLDNMDGYKIGESFIEFMKNQPSPLEKEIMKTGSFPGIIR